MLPGGNAENNVKAAPVCLFGQIIAVKGAGEDMDFTLWNSLWIQMELVAFFLLLKKACTVYVFESGGASTISIRRLGPGAGFLGT